MQLPCPEGTWLKLSTHHQSSPSVTRSTETSSLSSGMWASSLETSNLTKMHRVWSWRLKSYSLCSIITAARYRTSSGSYSMKSTTSTMKSVAVSGKRSSWSCLTLSALWCCLQLSQIIWSLPTGLDVPSRRKCTSNILKIDQYLLNIMR